jgi:hypothetical protein
MNEREAKILKEVEEELLNMPEEDFDKLYEEELKNPFIPQEINDTKI